MELIVATSWQFRVLCDNYGVHVAVTGLVRAPRDCLRRPRTCHETATSNSILRKKKEAPDVALDRTALREGVTAALMINQPTKSRG